MYLRVLRIISYPWAEETQERSAEKSEATAPSIVMRNEDKAFQKV